MKKGPLSVCRDCGLVGRARTWRAGAATDTCSWMPPLPAADVFDSSLIACVDSRVGAIQSKTPCLR